MNNLMRKKAQDEEVLQTHFKTFHNGLFCPFPAHRSALKNRFVLVLVQRQAEGSDMSPIKTQTRIGALFLAFAAILKSVFSMR